MVFQLEFILAQTDHKIFCQTLVKLSQRVSEDEFGFNMMEFSDQSDFFYWNSFGS